MPGRNFVNGWDAARSHTFERIDLDCVSQLNPCLNAELHRRSGAKVLNPNRHWPLAAKSIRSLKGDFIHLQIGPQFNFRHLLGMSQRLLGVLIRGDGGKDSAASIVDTQEQPNGTRYAEPELPPRPGGSVARGVGSLPLGAKIVVASIPIWPAWILLFRGLDYFDGLGCRRHRWRAGGLVGLALGLFGLSFALWGWASP